MTAPTTPDTDEAPPWVTAGTWVTYTLTGADAAAINQHKIARNPADAGDEFPALIVRVWSPKLPGTSVQLQVFYDGAGTYWATSRMEGDGPGKWRR